MPRENHITLNGAKITWFEWGAEGDPVIFLSHATGLHSRCWDETVRHLDGYHAIAADHRGHGQSSNTPPFGWDQFGADLADLIDALDLKDIHGVGHSKGGHCMVQAAARERVRFRRLTLFDPVILEPQAYVGRPTSSDGHFVSKRRNAWESPEQMIESFKDRLPFSRWDPKVLEDYCRFGLVPDGEVYILACPPDIEAGIYATTPSLNVYDRISDIRIPVTVVRAEWRGTAAAALNFSLSPTWPELASRFAKGRDLYLPEFSHFLPMENPELAASIIRGTATMGSEEKWGQSKGSE